MPAMPIAAKEETTRAGKREQNAAQNRAAILQAAREAFCEIGFGATTVRDIIRRTGLASGTFYNYFPDKESLLHELVEDFQIELRRRVHEARESAETLEDLLRRPSVPASKPSRKTRPSSPWWPATRVRSSSSRP